jgi:hypothetical protein
MAEFSDYIVYVDESGDHGLERINPDYPIFSLAFCIFKKDLYTTQITPALQRIKFTYWGHDSIVLHEHDIRKSMQGDYAILSNPVTRTSFCTELNNFISNAPFEIIASVIQKQKLTRYSKPSNPYQLAMLFCMERLLKWLYTYNQTGKTIHIIFESRGKKEDQELELEFRRICDNAPTCLSSNLDFTNIHFVMRFVDKKANLAGLQIADLIARPIGLHVLRSNQQNRAFEIIKHKFVSYKNGGYNGNGLKIFPQ